MDEREACPFTKVGILLKSRKNYMLVPVPVSVVLVPKATGDFLLWGTGTSFLGTYTNRLLHVGTGTIVCANAPPHSNTSRDFSTVAAINRNDLHSLFGHEPL